MTLVKEVHHGLNGDLRDVLPGDHVLIRVKVSRAQPGVGARVLLTSKTDLNYDPGCWVREEDVVFLAVTEVGAEEPPDETWLWGSRDGMPTIFCRMDSQAPKDEGLRWPLRWFEPSMGWMSWPAALTYGVNPEAVVDNRAGGAPGQAA